MLENWNEDKARRAAELEEGCCVSAGKPDASPLDPYHHAQSVKKLKEMLRVAIQLHGDPNATDQALVELAWTAVYAAHKGNEGLSREVWNSIPDHVMQVPR